MRFKAWEQSNLWFIKSCVFNVSLLHNYIFSNFLTKQIDSKSYESKSSKNALNSLMDLLIFRVHKVDLINYRLNKNQSKIFCL